MGASMTAPWFSFEDGSLRCDRVGPLTADDCAAIWTALPTTGAAWIERGRLLVTQRDGAVVYDLGPVAPDVRQPFVAIDRCAGCGQPAHASESDDRGFCAACAIKSGTPHLHPL
jgi:hypothetical protein